MEFLVLHPRASDILAQVRRVPEAERLARLRALAQGDESLVRHVLLLLDQDGAPTIAPAVSPADPPSATTGPADAPASRLHPAGARRLGPFRLLELLGEGGMGAVYLAEQDRPRRQVALKLVRPGLVTPRMLRRFELESEMLARLQHPGIAQVYQAGAADTPDGPQPYFAMECVRGLPLTEFARRNALDLTSRLQLFLKICDAVHHAHQKGVIHRDLKPGNILVTLPDGAPAPAAQPKILDFGIARTTDEAAAQHTYATEAGQLVGTVPYMSPEQISGDRQAVDTRSDVYTLGVILYELLSGRLPHAVHDKTLPEAARTISQDAPAPLRALGRDVRDDLRTIVGKALEKDRERRYQSASDLGADVARYMRHEPILARPPSAVYVFRKFASRNRAVVGGTAVALLALVAGVVVSVTQAVRASRAGEIARQEADFASSANEFLTGMLAAANPDQNNDRDITVREVVDRAAEQLDSPAPNTPGAHPRVAMSLHNTLSSTYRSLGEPAAALNHAKQAVDIATRLRGPDDPDTLDAQRTLAFAHSEIGEHDTALQITRHCLEQYERRLGPDHIEVARVRGELGRVLLEAGKFQEAESLLRPAWERMKTVLGDRHPDTITTADHLGLALQRLGKFKEAREMGRYTLATRESVFGVDSAVTAFSLNNLANIEQKLGNDDEAVRLLKRALDIRQRKLAPDHPSVLVSMSNLAVALSGLGKQTEAEPLLREAWTRTARKLGDSHPKALSAAGNLAYVLEDLGRLDEAEALSRQVVELRAKAGQRGQEAWGEMNNLAMLLMKRNKPAEAEPLYVQLLSMCEGSLPEDHYMLAIFRSNHGECLAALGRFQEAEDELLDAQPVLEKFFRPDHPRAAKGRERLRALYAAWNKPEMAARYEKKP